jgi:hypothetical protein
MARASVGQGPGDGVADVLNFQEVDDVLHLAPMGQLLLLRTAQPVHHAGQEVVLQQMVAADHDIVENRHVAEQRQVLEGAPDPQIRARIGAQAGDIAALEADASFLRIVTPRYAVQHRGLSGAVGADDRKQFARHHVERHVGQRLHAAETQ